MQSIREHSENKGLSKLLTAYGMGKIKISVLLALGLPRLQTME